tara:strand:+ start:18530 stop:18994 length:465 start_codon:yes stop_codon:yes gene_type:complete
MRRIALVAVFCNVGIYACGGGKGSGKPAHHAKPDVTDPAQAELADAGLGPNATSVALNEQDCEALLGHMFGLIYQQKTASLPEAEQPSPEDMEVAKDKLRAELMKSCKGADRAEFAYDCVMATTTFDALATCTSANSTPSDSTPSNSTHPTSTP